jgi:hypothetical protein
MIKYKRCRKILEEMILLNPVNWRVSLQRKKAKWGTRKIKKKEERLNKAKIEKQANHLCA